MLNKFSKKIAYFWYGSLTFARRDIKTRYAGSILGVVWIVVYPIAMAGITSFVFAVAFQKTIENIPFFVYTLAGFSAWIFFAQTISASARALVQNRDIIVNNKIPTELILGGVMMSRCLDLAITTTFVAVVAAILGVLVINPIVFIESVATLLSATAIFCLIVSAGNVYFRDVQALADIFLNVLFYATPIIYPLSVIPPQYLWIFNLNPLTPIFLSFRAALLPLPESLLPLSYIFVGSLLLAFLAFPIYKHLEKKFAQYL